MFWRNTVKYDSYVPMRKGTWCYQYNQQLLHCRVNDRTFCARAFHTFLFRLRHTDAVLSSAVFSKTNICPKSKVNIAGSAAIVNYT